MVATGPASNAAPVRQFRRNGRRAPMRPATTTRGSQTHTGDERDASIGAVTDPGTPAGGAYEAGSPHERHGLASLPVRSASSAATTMTLTAK